MKCNARIITCLVSLAMVTACTNAPEQKEASTEPAQAATTQAGQSGVKDEESQKDVVKVAIGSDQHTTLVKAIQAASLVDVLSNAGPFTVFAPTNAAFDKLPAGTLENLMKPENKESLANILQYHVYVGGIKTESMTDGQVLGQANGDNITLQVKDGKVTVNGKAHILASIQASNGIVHVIDEVLLPPAK
ncbi:fasciclin domain-containing protein [Flavihumibacter profundi]|uniref:fasciclin domain-containing protein n=1 Tax=Flavihumibacter profundi TaxID=2716883 RepID=UPI001CC75A00|nr:fasciclin domain-containing protein [Flavihumibacter profundi]MBZ5857111.1 fasciclin domain-containing protein [Flavihumibacter profundi]